MEILNPPDVMHLARGSLHGTIIGDILHVAGQVGINENGSLVQMGDIREQTRQAIRNVSNALSAGR